MAATGRQRHFEAAHAFGVFAFLMDYAVMYLTKRSRTIEVS